MPQLAKFLRGHELARDGLTVPNFTTLLIFNRAGAPPGNTLSLRPATADVQTAETDAGIPILSASSSQVLQTMLDFTDAASGIVQVQLRKNGAVAALQNYGAGSVGLQPRLVTPVTFQPGDVWTVGVALQNSGVGVSLSLKVALAFFS
jgi:hypothetical protein